MFQRLLPTPPSCFYSEEKGEHGRKSREQRELAGPIICIWAEFGGKPCGWATVGRSPQLPVGGKENEVSPLGAGEEVP